MKKEKIKVLIFVVLLSFFTEAQNTCDSATSFSCYIRNQSISPTAPFTVTNRNSSYPVTFLLIIDASMPKIPPTLFPNYPNISFFSIYNNGLAEISSESFQGCNNLGSAIIRNGLLTKIPDGTFKGCPNLASIQLTNHSISTLEVNAFDGLKNLNSLYLSNNLLTTINPNLLINLPKLLIFDVSSNLLTTLDANLFKQNPSLQAIYLDYNQISSLPSNLFPSQKLSTFRASYNKFTAFQSYGASYMDMTNNQLTSFNSSYGDETVYIAYNNIKRLYCPNITALSVKRLYAQNNFLTNFYCIKDMKNLTDLNVTSNSVRPTQKVLANLKNLRMFNIVNQQKYPKMLAKAFTNMTSLSHLYVDSFSSFVNIKKFMPNLYLLGLSTKSWSCNRTQQVANVLGQQKIKMYFNYYTDRFICNVTLTY